LICEDYEHEISDTRHRFDRCNRDGFRLRSIDHRAGATERRADVAGSWAAPYGQATGEKTRAQVYQELVHAEKDGQLAYLNSTLYAH
jgi:hypothetical protein